MSSPRIQQMNQGFDHCSQRNWSAWISFFRRKNAVCLKQSLETTTSHLLVSHLAFPHSFPWHLFGISYQWVPTIGTHPAPASSKTRQKLTTPLRSMAWGFNDGFLTQPIWRYLGEWTFLASWKKVEEEKNNLYISGGFPKMVGFPNNYWFSY